MTFNKTAISGLLLSLLMLSSCGESNSILNNRNFDEGNWLLVVENESEKTLFIVNDKNILKANPFGILLGSSANCSGTTCDGFIELYKDGELIASQEFLSKADVIEKQSLKDNYKKATTDCISPLDQAQYKQLWDSLAKAGNIYPIRYHTQPEDKDIICYYKY